MTPVANEKAKLLNRIGRLLGQVAAIERAIDSDLECAEVLQQATACRGALHGLIAEVIEHHIREHVLDPLTKLHDRRTIAAGELIGIVHRYLQR
jgi:DNA-binding FrmR family transcriptional regulator